MRSSSTRAFLALALSVASLALLQNLVIPVIPVMQSDLGVTADAASWTMTAWLIAAAVATPVLGRVGDLRGRRGTFLAVLVVVMIGDLVAFYASNLGILLIGRVLQGVGGALFPLAFGLIRDTVPRERVTGAIGAMSAIIGIGGAAGSVLAGPLSESVGWRGLFLVPLILSIVGVLLTVAWVPRSRPAGHGTLNALSALLLSGWLVALLIPLTSGARWGWTSPAVLGLLALAVLLFAGWVVAELRAKEPLVDIRMLLDRAIWPTQRRRVPGRRRRVRVLGLPAAVRRDGAGDGLGPRPRRPRRRTRAPPPADRHVGHGLRHRCALTRAAAARAARDRLGGHGCRGAERRGLPRRGVAAGSRRSAVRRSASAPRTPRRRASSCRAFRPTASAWRQA